MGRNRSTADRALLNRAESTENSDESQGRRASVGRRCALLCSKQKGGLAMKEECLSRRSFVWGGAALAAATLAFSQDQKAKLTADEVVDRIKSKVGIPWRAQT